MSTINCCNWIKFVSWGDIGIPLIGIFYGKPFFTKSFHFWKVSRIQKPEINKKVIDLFISPTKLFLKLEILRGNKYWWKAGSRELKKIIIILCYFEKIPGMLNRFYLINVGPFYSFYQMQFNVNIKKFIILSIYSYAHFLIARWYRFWTDWQVFGRFLTCIHFWHFERFLNRHFDRFLTDFLTDLLKDFLIYA